MVDTDNNLLAGNHRLQAIKNLGYKKIECKKVNLTEQKNRLVEIDENLIHNDLSIIEKSKHIALKESILEELGVRATPEPVPLDSNFVSLSTVSTRVDTGVLSQ